MALVLVADAWTAVAEPAPAWRLAQAATPCAAGEVQIGGQCVALDNGSAAPPTPPLAGCANGQVEIGGQCVAMGKSGDAEPAPQPTPPPPPGGCANGQVEIGGQCVAMGKGGDAEPAPQPTPPSPPGGCASGQVLIGGQCVAMEDPARPQQAPAEAETGRPPAPRRVPADYVTPVVIQLGKWVEGIAFDGRWLWAAQSGQRSIAKIDLGKGAAIAEATVGRLPVGMVSAGHGVTYALVATDSAIWRQPRDGKGSVIARVPGCPAGLTLAGDALWVLTWPTCSSEQSQLIQVLPDGRQQASPPLGTWGQALTPVGGDIWTAHVRDTAISVTRQSDMRTNWINARGASLWAITANARSVFAGGRVEENNNAGLVVMFDPEKEVEIRRATLSERVAQIACDDDHVIAVGEKGTIWILSARDLSVERKIVLTTGRFDPKSILLLGNRLLVSAGTYNGDSGAVLLIEPVFPR